jgi:hypothetical protein
MLSIFKPVMQIANIIIISGKYWISTSPNSFCVLSKKVCQENWQFEYVLNIIKFGLGLLFKNRYGRYYILLKVINYQFYKQMSIFFEIVKPKFFANCLIIKFELLVKVGKDLSIDLS